MKKFLSIISYFLIVLVPCTSQEHDTISLTLSQRQVCDLELILNEGFAPLTGFMNQEDYKCCVSQMRLKDGSLWSIPITLDVDETMAQRLKENPKVLLKGEDNIEIAWLDVEDIYQPVKEEEALHVYGTLNQEHPGVNYLFNNTKEYYVGGKVTLIALPRHVDFNHLRKTPKELKEYFKNNGVEKVVAFQTRNPMHRAHFELTFNASKDNDAHLLLHPVVGLTKPGDVDYFTRVKIYQQILKYYPENSVTLSLLPLSMRMAGPREALWHAIIRKNHGCTHFIIGRDHAGPGKDSSGQDFYPPYDAQDLVIKHQEELGITVVPFQEMVYVQEDGQYYPRDEVPSGKTVLSISGTQFRDMLNKGTAVPEWFSFPEVMQELEKTYPPRNKQGLTLFFTGLSASGKTTLANAVASKLAQLQDRKITLLDGDVIRTFLTKGLGFSKEDRSTNVQRVGYVASEITKHGGIAICSLISPYEEDRQANRKLISSCGGYIEIYVATPLETCEERDPKGMYKKAREGIMKNFTGISDPYEPPEHPELIIDSSKTELEENVSTIISYLQEKGYLLNE